jgi:hypothetical protein
LVYRQVAFYSCIRYERADFSNNSCRLLNDFAVSPVGDDSLVRTVHRAYRAFARRGKEKVRET